MPKNSKLEQPFLIKLDTLLLTAVEHERKVVGETRGLFRETGEIKLPPRAQVLRALLREGIDARRLARGEEIPVVIASTPMEESAAAVVEETTALQTDGTADTTSAEVLNQASQVASV